MCTRSDIMNSSMTLENKSAFSRASTIRVTGQQGEGWRVLNRTPTEIDLDFLDIDNLDEVAIEIESKVKKIQRKISINSKYSKISKTTNKSKKLSSEFPNI